MTELRQVCFVLMPFGKKPDGMGHTIDFDAVYREGIAPAISDAGLEPIRADEEETDGIIHKPMFERLVLCQFAVADLTSANANVFYELGVRHAVRPWSTVLIFADNVRLPFDVTPLRALPYQLNAAGTLADAAQLREQLSTKLRRAVDAQRESPPADSPLFQLLDGYPDIDHERTDIFRKQVEYSRQAKEQLAAARNKGVDAVREVEQGLGPFENVETGVLVDLFLSYRACSAWNDMIRLVSEMPRVLAETVMIQEQYAFALNRARRRDEAESTLLDLIKRRGPSSETCGILGRVYKDRWDEARKNGNTLLARGMLQKAIDAYMRGFEADWRDAYPGVNAVTLMELREPPDPRRIRLAPIVKYAVERRVAGGNPDYWDHATLLELSVLSNDPDGATSAASDALAAVRESWEPETTARNLALIRDARAARGEVMAWANDIETELVRRSQAGHQPA